MSVWMKVRLFLLFFLGLFAVMCGTYVSYTVGSPIGGTTEQGIDYEEDASYYGCPNSKRVKKLITAKKRRAR